VFAGGNANVDIEMLSAAKFSVLVNDDDGDREFAYTSAAEKSLISDGAPIKAVQAQLGHQSAELTLDRYGHLYPDQMDVLAARLGVSGTHNVECCSWRPR
jgi:hypothetical protein